VVRALECWVEREGEDVVARLWNSSPFGSRVVIDAVVADPRRMACRLVKDFESERQTVSVARLKELWGSEVVAYPASVDIEELVLRQQLHDTISLVELPGRLGRGREKVVFKSTVHEVKYMYHELKLLLTMPSHSGIMPKPLYLVTAKDRYGGEDKVFGFILPFFEGGNLADELSRRKYNGTLNLKDQFRWARQIAETLKVINISTARFYSELKADNLLLDKDENVLFIDFEQMGKPYRNHSK
jgi:serine/threonine protein kinase